MRDLSRPGPLLTLDRSLLLLRRGGAAVLVPAWMGGGLVAAVVVGAYVLERVEGVHHMRLLIAFALVVAWWARALLAASAARAGLRILWPDLPVADDAGHPVDVVRTASVVAMGLWLWLWPLVGAMTLSPFAMALVLPFFALRGAVAPSWIARASCTADAGWRAFWRSASDTSDRRLGAGAVELLVLLASAGLFVNLFAASWVFTEFWGGLAGMDVTFMQAFLSMRNTFMWLVVGAAALALLEPLRVAVSVHAYVEARVLQEGLDLREAVVEAIHASSRRGASAAAKASAAALAFSVVLASPGAMAQPPDHTPGTGSGNSAPILVTNPRATLDPALFGLDGAEPGERPGRADDEVRAQVYQILERPEFEEYAERRRLNLIALLTRWLKDLLEREPEPAPAFTGPSIPMFAPSAIAVLLAVIVALVAAFLAVSLLRSRTKEAAIGEVAPLAPDDPRDRAPEEHLDEASVLAREGRFREALRSLFLATLVALDRKRVITFDVTLTNWQYIRAMPRSEQRTWFISFTRLFDHKWYGHEATTEQDYVACRQLAEAINAGTSRP